jgi:penicillin amidase
MRGSVTPLPLIAYVLLLTTACREPALPPLVPELSGTFVVAGLSAPVRVVRDRWGVPHIYAQTAEDLFAAQGFVQAQDRLFQMDLWRRSAQGRLSEVLGANFVERDAMTRRMQYRGDLEAEWASYGADVKAIATSFVRGINAWVGLARDRPPEEFVLAGWKPDFWSPTDLLNRTDAFVASGGAIDEIRRAGMSDVIADAIRSAGAPPFFAGGAAVQPDLITVRANGHVTATRAGLLSLAEAGRALDHPSRRYFVHLNAPGWNVVGATAPWRPGVAMGHNERVAWGMTSIDADTQDIYTEPADGSKVVLEERIVVKGRATPFLFGREYTEHGVIVASDREHHQVFTIRWSGTEPGAAPELASLAIDRAGAWPEFRAALARWKMPARRVVYADTDGNIGFQDAALIPIRRAGEWTGWRTIDDLPHAFNRRGDAIDAADARRDPPSAVGAGALFVHPLAITADRRQRFNVGPLGRPGDVDSPVRALLDPSDWDRSRAMNAPGQSESPASPHFSDLATVWSSGELVPLLFSDAAVQANTASSLTLVSARRR